MRDFKDGSDAGPAQGSGWRATVFFANELKSHIRLLFVFALVAMICAVVVNFAMKPVYTATAIVGPPGPSPTSSMLSGIGGAAGGNSASLVRRLVGGGGGAPSANDPFQEYMQLLQSARLAAVLVKKDHILQTLFPTRWDASRGAWRAPGGVHLLVNRIKAATGRPVKIAPDVDDVIAFFQKNLYIGSAAKPGAKSTILTDTSYPEIALSFGDPRKAEAILDLVLLEADNVIRDDLGRDVSARLTFLQGETARTMAADQRDALIAVLSGQEQLQMMLKADSRFASTMIDPPYAPDDPTSPSPLLKMLTIALLLSLLAWLGIVYLATKLEFVARNVMRIERIVGRGD